MATIVLDHVKAAELPADWRKRIKAKPGDLVRVTLDKEVPVRSTAAAGGPNAPNGTFGMWADRTDVGDASEYVATLRQPRRASNK